MCAGRLRGSPGAGRALDARYPNQVDAAVNKALWPLTHKNKRLSKGAPPPSDEPGVTGGPDGAQRALAFVRRALDRRGARAVLRDAPATLALAVDAPSVELRRLVRCRPGHARSVRLCACGRLMVAGGCVSVAYVMSPVGVMRQQLHHWGPRMEQQHPLGQ